MSASHQNRVVIYSLLLVAAILAFYNPIIHNQFIEYDDLSYVVKNTHVLNGLTWDTIKWAFTTGRDGNWHPLTWLSHALDCQLFGLNPVGHHYTNLLLHSANAVLLFLLLRRATGFNWSSLMVAALFAVHPVNVESVVWAAERKNVLSMLFFLLALLVYDRYARTGGWYRYLSVNILFALGLMAKPQIVTLPFVLLLWDYWPLQRMGVVKVKVERSPDTHTDGSAVPSTVTPRSFAYLVFEKSPLFLLAAADSVVTVLVQRAGDSVRTFSEVSLSVRLENVIVTYIRYFAKAFWPSRLAPLYPRPENSLPIWQVVGAAVVLLAVSALVLRSRNRRYLPVGWFWFLGTLVPMIGFITVGEQAMADRYAYIPFIGLFIAVVWFLGALAAKYRIANAWLTSAALLVLAILGCLTYRQVGYWRDNETLWRYTLRVTDRNYVAHNNLAIALAKLGRADESVVEFRSAMALHKYPPAQILALTSFELHAGRIQEAIEDSNLALRASTDPKTQAAAYSELGQAHLQLRDYDQAAGSYQKALQLNPDDGVALIGTGLLALSQGQFDPAVNLFFHAVKVDPTDANVLLFAQALRRAGHLAEADSATAQVQKIAENFAQAQSEAAQMLSFVGLKPL
jgi:tetratricopeptide (TPR) repeat protein